MIRRKTLVLDLKRKRRAAAARLIAYVLVAATSLAPLRFSAAAAPSGVTGALPDDLARRSSERIRPISIEEDSGKVGQESLWRLFDGDAASGLEAGGPVRIRMTFATVVTVDAVGAFGATDGLLSLLGTDGAGDGAGAVARGNDGAAGDPSGWKRLLVKKPAPGRTFVVEWLPAKSTAVLPELEIWGRAPGGGGSASTADDLPDGVVYQAAESDLQVAASVDEKSRTFSVTLPHDPRSIERAFLVYDLAGLPHFTAAKRAINGGPAVGGFGTTRSKGGPQVEEIAVGALRKGTNLVRFDASPANDPIGYHVSRLRLLTTGSSAARAVTDGDELSDGRETTGWQDRDGSARQWRFSGITQPRELEFRLVRGNKGTLLIAGGAGLQRQRVTVDLSALRPGWHKVALDALPPLDTLSAALEGGSESNVFLSELSITGSPLPVAGRSRMRITFPQHGECVDHRVHVRGIVTPAAASIWANGKAAPAAILETGGFSFTASEKELGGAAGKPFTFSVEARPRQGESARTEVKVEGCVDAAPSVASAGRQSPPPVADVGAPYGVEVSPDQDAELKFGGATLDVPAGAVDSAVRLTVRPLAPQDVPPLDPGMNNVTAGGRAFRLGPHGMQFKKGVALTLPYDKSRVDPADRARIFYYDEGAKRWQEVERLGDRDGTVVAETTHFTDFISATMIMPEHPGLQSLNPTSLKGIKLADPGAGVTQIAPPEANSKGTANLSYPIEVPPGRHGMQPHLTIAYDSGAGNGWLGTGWNLAISSMEVDTRFGVPKYDGTERYVLDGEELTPLSTPPAQAPAGTYFARRNEAAFDWIQRLGSATTGFSWLVTDKNGTTYTYGSTAAGRLTSNGDAKKAFRWCLEKVEDIWGNQIIYTYTTITGTIGATATKDTFQQIYPAKVQYTATKNGTLAPQYSVVFNLKTGRGDSFSTGRPGFLVLTDRLLDSVEVRNGTNIVRKYQLAYTAHDFGKNLLDSISLFGQGGTGNAIAKHGMTYHKAPTGTDGNPKYFDTPLFYTTPLNGDTGPATKRSINDSTMHALSNNTSIGVSGFNASAENVGIATLGEQALLDANGDGLPDLLPSNVTDGNIQIQAGQPSDAPKGDMAVRPFTDWATPYSLDLNSHLTTSYELGPLKGSEEFGHIAEAGGFLIDVNGDGLPDRIQRSTVALATGLLPGVLDELANITGIKDPPNWPVTVQLNKGNFTGFAPPVDFSGYIGTGLHFDCSDILFGTSSPITIGTASSNASTVPSSDIITKWEARSLGNVHVSGILQRPGNEVGGDGMVASLFFSRGTSTRLLWQRDIGPSDTSACVPAFDINGTTVGTGCASTSAGSPMFIQPGDRLYTRVNGKSNLDHDLLQWDLTVAYDDTPAFQQTAREAWGPLRYKWSEANEQRAMGQFFLPWTATTQGVIDVGLDVDKVPSADDATVEVILRTDFGDLTLSSKTYGSQSAGPEHLDLVPMGVNPGDQVFVWVKSDLPIDPDTVQALATIQYQQFCRTNTTTGTDYCGEPHCVPVDSNTENGAQNCTIEPSGWQGVSQDPLASQPIPGSVINQALPAYHPLQKFVLQPAFTPFPGNTVDARTAVFATDSTNTAQICLNIFVDNPGNTVTMAIQGVNKLWKKETFPLIAGDGAACLVASGIPSGDQVIYSVYADQPIDSGTVDASARLNGALQPVGVVEQYFRDPSAPTIDHYPSFGQRAPMAGGFHDFYAGSWSGNQPFDESKIVEGTTNGSYLPTIVGPTPIAQGSGFQHSFSLGGLLHAATTLLAPGSNLLWNATKKSLEYTGSLLIGGLRKLGSIAGRILGWALCEGTPAIHDVNGIKYSEMHSVSTGLAVGPVTVSSTAGASVSGMDLIDMNGDRYPDQVSTAGIRYLSFNPSTSAGSFGPTTPTVQIPGHSLRISTNSTYTVSVGGGGSAPSSADAQSSDSGGRSSGVQYSAQFSDNVSQGLDRLSRDLRDVNGDGLPDLIEVLKSPSSPHPDPNLYQLQVRLNYGYGFGNPIIWSSAPWSNASAAFPADLFNLVSNRSGAQAVADILNVLNVRVSTIEKDPAGAIRVEETGHKGRSATVGASNGQFSGSAGGGVDHTYVRTYVDLVDVNGDGLPDQIMKLPGKPFQIKLNTGTAFAAEKTSQADPWPGLAVFGADGTDIVAPDVDVLGFRRNDGWDLTGQFGYFVFGGGSSYAHGSMLSIIDFMDIDGDGRVDQVLKNVDTGDVSIENGPIWIRRNTVGKTNMLASVSLPLGGSIGLDYTRNGNMVATVNTPSGTTKVDAPEARLVLSKVTVDSGRGATTQNPAIDTIDYNMPVAIRPVLNTPGQITSAFYDRNEREFLGFGRVTVTHGVPNQGTYTNGDGSQKWLFYQNQHFFQRSHLLAEYDVASTNGQSVVLRGSVKALGFALVPNTTPGSAWFISYLDIYDAIYDGNVPASFLNTIDPINISALPLVPDDGSVIHRTFKQNDTNGDLIFFLDLGDMVSSTDDVLFTITNSTFAGTHFTAPTSIVAGSNTSDGIVFQQRTATYGLQLGHPALSTVTDAIFGGNMPGGTTPYTGQQSTSSFTFNAADFGNPATFTDPTSYKLSYVYDSTHTYVTKVTDGFGYVSSMTPNLDFGVPATTTDANGKVVTYNYDTFGRPSKVWGPTDPTTGTPTIQMTYSQAAAATPVFPASAVTKHKDIAGTIDTVTFVDGLGRLIQTKKETERWLAGTKTSGFSVSGDILFDARGRVISQAQPTFSTAAATTFVPPAVVPLNPTVYGYDGIGRTTLVSVPDPLGFANTINTFTTLKPNSGGDSLSSFTGNLELTTTIDANDRVHNTYRDGAARIVAVKDFNMIGSDGPFPLVTIYGYDSLGNLATVTDPVGHLTQANYDSQSRLVTLISPDAGTVEYRYALNGNLAEKLTAGGSLIKYGYDVNRLKTVTYPTPSMNVSFTYGASTETGDAAGNLASRIKSVTMEGGTETRTYDAFGNINKTVTTLKQMSGTQASPVATMKYSYDWLGRMQSMTFPRLVSSNWTIPTGDGEIVKYTYDNGGLLKNIASTETYVSDIGYDEFGARVMMKAGNNVTTLYGYEPLRRFLKTATANAGTVPFLSMVYGYDRIGNIMNADNTTPVSAIAVDSSSVGVGPMSVGYSYDMLDQLVGATARYRGHTTFGERYATTLAYDEIGNITSKAQTDMRLAFRSGDTTLAQGTDLATQTATTYTLEPSFSANRPHQPLSVTETSASGVSQVRSLAFDANGNKTTDIFGTKTRTFTWDEENRLKAVADQVGTVTVTQGRYLYNPQGERTQKQDPQGNTTFYVNQYLVLHADKNVTKHIFAGETRMVSKMESSLNPNNPARMFYNPDNVGSTAYVTNASGTLIEHDRYFPFGETWGPSERVAFANPNGSVNNHRNWLFTGKELDTDTGLYYFGARYYDPRSSTWPSPDPILASYMSKGAAGASPKNLGLYSYAWNNPVVMRDPDGRAATGFNHVAANQSIKAAQAAAAAQQAAAAAQAARYQAWFNSLPPSHQAMVRRYNAGGAAIATNAALERASQNAQVGGKALTVMAQGAVAVATGMASEAAFPSATGFATRAGSGPGITVDSTAPLVIGENMPGRVAPYAEQIGGEIYTGMPGFAPGMEEQGLIHNMSAIDSAMSQGRTIIDMGPDYAKRAITGVASPNYTMEQALTRGYPGLRSVNPPVTNASSVSAH